MKRFTILMGLVILTLSLISLGFASDENSGAAKTQIGDKLQQLDNSELRQDRVSSMQSYDWDQANPKATIPEAGMSLAKVTGIPAGTYPIPGPYGSSIAAVAGYVNGAGIDGPVIFELINTTYNEPTGTTFGSYSGNTNLLTIRPAAGTAVTVNFVSTASNGKGISFNDARNITIDGINASGASLTLRYSGGTFPVNDLFAATVYITGNSQYITVRNATVHGNIEGAFETQTNGRAAIFLYAATGQLNQYITVDGCTIINATFGFKSLQQFTAPTFFISANHVWFTNNKVGGAFGGKVLQGILAEATFGFRINNNIFDGIEVNPRYFDLPSEATIEYNPLRTFSNTNFLYWFGQYSAVHVYNIDNLSTVLNNHVKSVINTNPRGFLVYGMTVRISNVGRALVANNRIQGVVNMDNTGQTLGFRTTNMNIYHNSVLLNANMTGYPSHISTCMNNDGASVIRNNAFSNEITGGTASFTRGVNSATVIDYCAINSNGWFTTASPGTITAGVGAGCNPNGLYGPIYFTADLHIDNTQPTSASNIGQAGLTPAVPLDIDVETRSLTTPDAGVDEFADAPLIPVDLLAVLIPSPGFGGVPSGIAHPVIAGFKNNSNTPAASDVNVTISGPETYNNTVPGVAFTSAQYKTVTFAPWTPNVGGGSPRTVTATTLLSDANNGNNTFSRSQPVSDPVAVTTSYCTDFNTAGTRAGWTGTGDFALAGVGGWNNTNFTKLGGAYNDAAPASRWSWVSKPGPPLPGLSGYASVGNPAIPGSSAWYHSDQRLSQVQSPFFNLSGMTGDVYVSFVHSVDVEGLWERSWMWYTTDGVVWRNLGTLNDPNGINWYSTAVYKNAMSGSDGASCLDLSNWNTHVVSFASATMNAPQPGWSSNFASGTSCADGVYWDAAGNTGGPNGWVFVQIKLPAAIKNAPVIRFAYATFADFWYTDEGWAFDKFCIGPEATFTGGFITGNVFHDLNGNGVKDVEPNNVGDTVRLSYFGVPVGFTLTDANGNYSFDLSTLNNGLPGTYNVRLVKPGYAFTLPFGTTGIRDVNHPGDGSTIANINFGKYQGFVSGLKFNDLLNNGVYDPGVDPPLSGWTIQLHKDSANGPLIGSAVTAANGTYTISAPAYFWGAGNPGNYVVKEIPKPTVARQTFPAAPGTHTIQMTGTSGPTNIVDNKNFGNFVYAIMTVKCAVDRSGDGIEGLEDQFFIPIGQGKVSYEFWKGAVRLDSFTLGDGVLLKIFYSNDTGTYTIKRVTPIPSNWIETTPNQYTVVVDSCMETHSVFFGYFRYVTVTGKKFEVKEGNPGLENWTINVTGGTYFGSNSALTAGDGTYSIDSIGPGSHTIDEVLQTGWRKISPTSPYNFTAYSGHVSINNPKNQDFGNFKNVSISGVKYRDFNGNCTVDGQDYGMAEWTVNLTGAASASDVTDQNGEYSFTGLGPGTYTVTEEVKQGFVTECVTFYEITVVSGTDVTGKNFFNTGSIDDKKFTTFICPPVEAAACAKAKPVKDWTAKKPTVPNYANLVSRIVIKTEQALMVGLEKQLNAGGKEKAYFRPKAYGDVWKTLCDKGTKHTGPARGFDVTNKGGLMLKRWASVSPNKKNDKLVQELAILDINILASVKGITPSGFGNLCYYEPGNALHGMSINAIAAYADGIMTNWEGVPFATYDNLYYVAGRINAAFYDGFGYDVTQWQATTPPSVLYFPGVKALNEVEYLRACTGGAPIATPPAPEPLPTVYALGQNYPNPFNPTTTVSFDLPFTSIVTLKIYNMLGQEVGTLFDREEFEAGVVEETFDASTLASGIYLYRIVAEQIDEDGVVSQTFTQVKKMVLVK